MMRIDAFPVSAILGPRQCGKTTLARSLSYDHYFDLENPRDAARLDQPQLTLEDLRGLIVIDEIQRLPDIFPLLRYLVDTSSQQKYLILGSASRDLIKQSSESLAGRIAYFHLGGLRIHDVPADNLGLLWLRGGFPDAYTAKTNKISNLWRENFITTFLERDIPQLGISIPAQKLRRFWIMISHYHGQVVNYSEIGRSFGISDMTVRNYLEILSSTFMVRILQPWFTNIGKRIIKRPKLYIRDSGIYHSLLQIESLDQLQSHIKLGASWEGFALECICRTLAKRDETLFFWRTHSGIEVDLLLQAGGKTYGFECKYSDAPRLKRSMKIAAQDLNLEHLWIVYPGKQQYRLTESISVIPLRDIPASAQLLLENH
ncbi:ATP-binding protein [candidate division CSSED10-310 bacterium]|uniref:ATP-binding protein n=1 Tax=candidate division CSSED10-310 bacterium TaxID=2855610 RepID=A0ABV6Z1S0_UNCC1